MLRYLSNVGGSRAAIIARATNTITSDSIRHVFITVLLLM